MIKIEALIDEIDYNALIDKFAPVIAEQALKKENQEGKSGGQAALPFIKFTLKMLPQEKKEEMAVEMLNSGKAQIGDMILEELKKQGLSMKIVEMKAEKQ